MFFLDSLKMKKKNYKDLYFLFAKKEGIIHTSTKQPQMILSSFEDDVR